VWVHVFWAIARVLVGLICNESWDKNKYNKNRKGQKRNISPTCPDAPVDQFVPNLVYGVQIFLQSVRAFCFSGGGGKVRNLPLTWPVAVNTVLVLPRSLWGCDNNTELRFHYNIGLRWSQCLKILINLDRRHNLMILARLSINSCIY